MSDAYNSRRSLLPSLLLSHWNARMQARRHHAARLFSAVQVVRHHREEGVLRIKYYVARWASSAYDSMQSVHHHLAQQKLQRRLKLERDEEVRIAIKREKHSAARKQEASQARECACQRESAMKGVLATLKNETATRCRRVVWRWQRHMLQVKTRTIEI